MQTPSETAALRTDAVALPSRFSFNIPLITFVILQVLDLLSTLLVFAHGGVELNPAVRSLIPILGKLPAVLLCKAILVAVAWTVAHRRKRALIVADCLYAAVVIWNFVALLQISNSGTAQAL